MLSFYIFRPKFALVAPFRGLRGSEGKKENFIPSKTFSPQTLFHFPSSQNTIPSPTHSHPHSHSQPYYKTSVLLFHYPKHQILQVAKILWSSQC